MPGLCSVDALAVFLSHPASAPLRYYLVWNWDNAIWGTSCLLAALQPGVMTRYSTEIEGFLAR